LNSKKKKELTLNMMMMIALFASALTIQQYKRKNVLYDQCMGMLIGTAVGDAKGIPYENMTNSEIQSLLIQKSINIEESVYEQCDDLNPYIPHFYGPGKWTDDTQLSIAMARGITRMKEKQNGDLDMKMVVEEHVLQWRESLIGWGGTRTAIERLANGSHDWTTSGNAEAVGNGVLMKLCPLAFYYSLLPDSPLVTLSKKSELVALTRMTHGSPPAIVTALVFCAFEESIYRNNNLLSTETERIQLLKKLIELSKQYEKEFQPNESSTSCNLLSLRLSNIYNYLIEDQLSDAKLIEITNGGTFFCVDSASMVIGLIIREKPSFSTILKAAFIGGDTDSNAAMVGGIVGGVYGLQNTIPSTFIQQLHQHDRILQVGREYADSLRKLVTIL
jgi:ADP-ribosylglycohydrolase